MGRSNLKHANSLCFLIKHRELALQAVYAKAPAIIHYTLLWKENCPYYTLLPVFSSSGYYSDGIACVALEASEDGLSCCWVTELQGGLTTSLRTVGHTGSVETVGSWA